MADFLWWVAGILFLAAIAVYLFLTRNYGVFEAQGLYSIKPTFLIGNMSPVFMGKENYLEFHVNLYKKFKGHKYVHTTFKEL